MGVKFTSTGGHDAWNTRRYLNIWVCNLTSDLLGYSSMPMLNPAVEVDGIVIDFEAFGLDGTTLPPYHKGRTATHELGHFFNVLHIWGSGSCGDDLVDDTPKQLGPTFDCQPTVAISRGCGSSDPRMFMNYMDYSNDECMNTFTEGQGKRMHSLFSPGGFRERMLHSILALEAPDRICASEVIVSVKDPFCTPQGYPVITGPLEFVNWLSETEFLCRVVGNGSGVATIKLTNGIYTAEKNIEVANNPRIVSAQYQHGPHILGGNRPVFPLLEIRNGVAVVNEYPRGADVDVYLETSEPCTFSWRLISSTPATFFSLSSTNTQYNWMRFNAPASSRLVAWEVTITNSCGGRTVKQYQFLWVLGRLTVHGVDVLPESPTDLDQADSETSVQPMNPITSQRVTRSSAPQSIVFPNPATDKLNLVIKNSLNESNTDYVAYLHNAQGQLMESFSGNSTGVPIELPIGHLPDGFYLVHVRTNSETTTHKVLKSSISR